MAARGKQGQGLWTGGDNEGWSQVHQRQTGPDKCGETLRMQGREQLDRKASILKAPHPGMQTFIHLFIPQIIIQYPLCANQCQAQQTQQRTKWTNIPAFMEFLC